MPKNKQIICTIHDMKFFTYLFYEKHRRPGTVAHYRTALTIPLKMYFQVDLRIPAVADLLRSMNLQRPIIPVTAPDWSLNKVLTFLDNPDNIQSMSCNSGKQPSYYYWQQVGE